MVRLTASAAAALRDGEVLVFDWHRVALCCAAAGETSLHCLPHSRVDGHAAFRPLPADPPGTVVAHRMALPHLAGLEIVVDCHHRLGMRHFTSDLPADFGLRATLGRVPVRSAPETTSPRGPS